MPSRGYHTVGHWWLTPANLATQEAEIRRITVRSQPGEIVGKTLPHTHTHTHTKPSQKRTDGVTQHVGPEFKPQYCKKKKKERERERRYCTVGENHITDQCHNLGATTHKNYGRATTQS
jgi:hypothetical protein